MRDFKNNGEINVGGDLNVTDSSHNEHKLLVHCSTEELLQERPFRQENITIEQKKKINRLKPLYALSLVLFIVAALWAAINGKTDIVTVFMGGASIFLGFQTLKATLEPNAFQIEEQNAVNEISTILKQRRAE